ncbi:MAG TPA: vWA domain-containing protein [Polyangia bacterium]
MARNLGLACVALFMLGGLACAEVDDSVDGGIHRDDAAAVLDGDHYHSLACAVTEVVDLDPRQADVLVLLDRSGSMDTAFGSGTRFEAVASLLSDLVGAYATHVRFGYEEMPGRQDCAIDAIGGCCASPPLVSLAANNAQAVVSAVAAAVPMDGNTPTAASLQAALAYYQSLDDGIDNRFILLATDGAPNCTLAGELASVGGSNVVGAACADALVQVSALVAMGVRVIVLGIGADLAEDTSGDSACLDALAHAGGAAASPGSPGFYPASDPQQLQLAIAQIFGGVTRPSCLLRFGTPVKDPSTLAVFLDGQEIPRTSGGDGWHLDMSLSPPGVRITGVYCDRIERFQVNLVEARFGCPPCIDLQCM